MPSPPRPILKISPSSTLTATTPLPFPSSRLPFSDSLHVHFPPTPTMTQTEITHSSFSYDRKPIVVLPNTCALPGRGERDVHSEHDLEHLASSMHQRKKKAARGGYFHPRAYEAALEHDDAAAVESEQQPEPASSLLFARESSYLSSPYRIPNSTLSDSHPIARTQPQQPRVVRTVVQAVVVVGGTQDAPDAAAACDPSSTTGNFLLPMDACQFIQNIPHMDLSLSFMPTKQKSSMRKLMKARPRSASTSNFELTRKLVSSAAACGGFGSGLYDSGLEGCLGGF